MAPPKKHIPCDKTCKACGKTFHAVSAYQIQKQDFCSRTCRSAVHGNGRGVELIERECKTCGRKMQILPCHEHTKLYCSNPCKFIGQGEKLAGPNGPMWEGGNAKYWKREARRRDNFTCQFPGCGLHDPEGNTVHAHHKIPAKSGGPHTLENLISMCNRHHHEIERRLLARLLVNHPDIVREEVRQLYLELVT